MQLIYIEHLKGYVDLDSKYYPGDVFTEDDLDFLLQIEKQYRENLPDYNFYELIKIYPSAKNAMKRGLNDRLKAIKEKKKKYIEYMDESVIKLFEPLDDMQRIEVKANLEKEKDDFLDDLKKEEKKILFQKEYINRLAKEESMRKKIEKQKKKGDTEKLLEAEKELMEVIDSQPQKGITEEMILRAKDVPITNFLKVGRDGKVACLKHNERTPSMHIYRKKNNFYCFSCGFHGSVIDLIMEMQGLDFVGAVKYLNNI